MAVPRADRPLEECLRLVGHHALRLDRPALAEAVTGRAGALSAVERERARLKLRHGDVASRAGELLREEALPLALDGHEHDAGGEVECLLQARAQALEGTLAHGEAVDEHVDAVRAPRVEPHRLEKARRAAVDARTLQAGGAGGGELLAVAALPAPRDGRRHHRDEAVGLLHEPPRHLVGALRGDRLAAARAVRLSEAREEDPQVVVDLAHRADRRARVGDGRALLDGDRRREAAHRLDGGALHLLEELPRPRREALDVAPLALGVERVEGEAALAGPRGAGDHHEPLPRDVAVEVLQVVDPRAADADRLVSTLVHRAPAKTPSYRDGGCPRPPVCRPWGLMLRCPT